MVTIHWDALRAAKMRFLMAPPSDEAILKKTSQEGLEMVLDQHLKGTTATITYKVRITHILHCNPLQGNYRVELLHREIPVFITGNGFAVSFSDITSKSVIYSCAFLLTQFLI